MPVATVASPKKARVASVTPAASFLRQQVLLIVQDHRGGEGVYFSMRMYRKIEYPRKIGFGAPKQWRFLKEYSGVSAISGVPRSGWWSVRERRGGQKNRISEWCSIWILF